MGSDTFFILRTQPHAATRWHSLPSMRDHHHSHHHHSQSAAAALAQATRAQLAAHEKQVDLETLLLMLVSDAVLMLHEGVELDVSWVSKLRLLQTAKRELWSCRKQLQPEMRALLDAAATRPPPMLLAVFQYTGPMVNGSFGLSFVSDELSTRLQQLFTKLRPVAKVSEPWALCQLHPKQPAVVLPKLTMRPAAMHAALMTHLLSQSTPHGAAQPPAGAAVCDVQGLHGMLHDPMQGRTKAQAAATPRTHTPQGHPTLQPSGNVLGTLGPCLHQLEHAWEAACRSDTPDTQVSMGDDVMATPKANHNTPTVKALLPAVKALQGATDLLFATSRIVCTQALQSACQAYSHGLPPTYPLRVHRAAVQRAAAVLMGSAHGPARSEVLRRLHQECDALWAHGRQQCGAVSCTGRACGLPHAHHQALGVPHAGALTWVRATVAGTDQVSAPDPFHPHAANDWASLDEAALTEGGVGGAREQRGQGTPQRGGGGGGHRGGAGAAGLDGEEGRGRDKGSKGRRRAPVPAAPGAAAAEVGGGGGEGGIGDSGEGLEGSGGTQLLDVVVVGEGGSSFVSSEQ